MRFLACAVFALSLVQAQPPELRIDLSGPWRIQAGDDPAYARADFDAVAWNQVTAPLPPQRPNGFWWLRRTLVLPAWLSKDTPLALSVGGFNQVFEVFVNGQSVATVGSPSLRGAYTPRPRTFLLPAHLGQPGTRLTIAIRAWNQGGKWPSQVDASNLFPDRGPWMLTSQGNAPPADEGKSLAFREARSRSQGFGIALYIVVGLLVVFGWTFQRDRREFLFFAGLVFSEALLAGSGLAILVWDLPLSVAQAFAVFLQVSPFLLSLFAIRLLPGFWRWTAAPQAVSMLWIGGINTITTVLGLADPPAFLYFLGFPFDIATGVLMMIGAVRSARILNRESDRGLAVLALFAGALSLFYIPAVRIVALQLPYVASLFFITRAIFFLWVTLRMLAGLGAARQRLAGELEAARTVQSLLLRSLAPANVEAFYLPAQEVGGDFWHCYPSSQDAVLLVVGDVSGKGLKAAMLVSLVTGVLQNRHSDEPAAVLAELNRAVAGKLDGGFITASAALISANGRMRWANAGHPSPYADGAELSSESGLPLGIVTDAEYTEAEATAGQFTFVSDGVVEAADKTGELFGFGRTQEISTKSACEIAEAARAWGQNDDITVVTVRRING